MADYSEHYNLKKPSQEDFYNVDDFNDNADKIDAALYAADVKLGQAAQEGTLEDVKTDVAGVKADIASVSNKIGTATDTNGSATGGTLMAKINKLISDTLSHISAWTATRAAKIDTINTNVSVIGKTTDTGGNSTAGTVMGKLNSISKNAKKAYVWDGGKTKVSLGHISGYNGANNNTITILTDCFIPECDGIIQIGLTGTIGNAPSSAGIHGIGWSSIDANATQYARHLMDRPYMTYAKGTVISYGSSSFPESRGVEKLWETPKTNGEINLTAFLKVSKGAQLNIFSFPYTENVTISDVFVKYDIKEV